MTLHRAGCYATISGRELLFRIVPRSKADEKVTTPLLRNEFFHQKITSQTFFSLEKVIFTNFFHLLHKGAKFVIDVPPILLNKKKFIKFSENSDFQVLPSAT